MTAVRRSSSAWGGTGSDVLFVGRLSYCFEESQAVGGGGLGGFMLCQVWEVLMQVSTWLAVHAWRVSWACIPCKRVASQVLNAA